MYLALTILAIYGTIDTEEPPKLTRSFPGKLNSNYHGCKVHEAVGVEHHIHIPQVKPAPDVPQQ